MLTPKAEQAFQIACDRYENETIAELKQQRDEYKKDAERYRWLRDKSVMYESEDGGDSVWCVSGTSHQDCRPCEDDELDAAIDAAPKEMK